MLMHSKNIIICDLIGDFSENGKQRLRTLQVRDEAKEIRRKQVTGNAK